MTTQDNFKNSGRDLINFIKQACLEPKGSIEWDKIRNSVTNLLSENIELSEYIDSDGTSVLQAACENPKTYDIAVTVLRSIGFGKPELINHQGVEVTMTCFFIKSI